MHVSEFLQEIISIQYSLLVEVVIKRGSMNLDLLEFFVDHNRATSLLQYH
jgi:hypothetical protein